LHRAYNAVRGVGAGGGPRRPARRGVALRRRAAVLPRLGRGVSQRLGGGGPDARSAPGGRRAPAARGRGVGAANGADAPHREAQARGLMIRLENLTKHYGSFVAVDDISMEVPRGLLHGFLGPNGAGKTTTLRMIAGILRPTDGRVLIGGDDVHKVPLAAKMRLGFIPDRPFVYDKLTGAEFLRFVAGLYGQEGEAIDRRIAELLEVFELTSWKDELVEAYSHGMRQKLIISSALIHRPEVIVVDEGTVRQRLREDRGRGGWGRLTILLTAGGLFWLGVYGVLFRILKYFRGVEELGPLLAGKLLGLVLLAFVSILILSNVITALSSFFLAKDLDLLVSAPVDWLRLYLAKLWETVIHSSWMVALMIVPILAAFGVIYGGGVLFLPFAVLTIVPMLILPGVVGAALTLILVNVFPARRTRDLLSIIALGAAGGVILAFRLIRPQPLARPEGL